MTTNTPLNVLFLCTHNSARSIIAECVMNRLGMGKFRGYSAGSQPSGKVHPYALDLLRLQIAHDLPRRAQDERPVRELLLLGDERTGAHPAVWISVLCWFT